MSQESFERARHLAEQYGHGHLFAHADQLSEEERFRLSAEVEKIDFDLLESLAAKIGAEAKGEAARLEPAPEIRKGEDQARDAAMREQGERLLREGKVAAFVVAGGQGSRLGFDGPKGLYPATPVANKPLFRVFAEKIAAVGARVGCALPWYVMTSEANDDATRAAFAEADYFGLAPTQVRFLTQDMLPALDAHKRVILANRAQTFRSPNGHGGSLLALARSGALEDMRARGIEQIFYFQVDNPLVDIADPVFLGYHADADAEMSTKVVPKRDASEKVGVLGLIDGRYGVIEYSDLSPEDLEARDAEGKLRFSAGNIAVHALRRDFVESLTQEGLDLPYHLARKDIPAYDPLKGEATKTPGFKFETFVFDALARCKRSVVLSVDRQQEFAPIKNAEGEDSPRTSREAQVELHAGWLEARGCAVPRDGEGKCRVKIEIAPGRALGPDDLDESLLAQVDLNSDLFLD